VRLISFPLMLYVRRCLIDLRVIAASFELAASLKIPPIRALDDPEHRERENSPGRNRERLSPRMSENPATTVNPPVIL